MVKISFIVLDLFVTVRLQSNFQNSFLIKPKTRTCSGRKTRKIYAGRSTTIRPFFLDKFKVPSQILQVYSSIINKFFLPLALGKKYFLVKFRAKEKISVSNPATGGLER